MEEMRTAGGLDPNGDRADTHRAGMLEPPWPDRPWLDIDEAAAYLRTSKRTVYKLCALYKLVYYVTTGVRWFTKEDLDAYIASGRVDIYGRGRRGRKTA